MKKWNTKFISCLLVATTITMSSHVSALSNNSTFADIDDSYAKDAIIRLVELGIVQGVDETHFSPKRPLTRSQFVTLLVRALQLPVEPSDDESAHFNDVQGWNAPFIASAYQAGFVEGVGLGKFNPDGILSREQAAKMMIAALVSAAPSLKLNEHAVPPFTDVDRIADWAKPYVSLAAAVGLIKGQPDGTFHPKGNATREMAAVMSVSFLEAVERLRNGVAHDPVQHETQPPPYGASRTVETSLSIVPEFDTVFAIGQEQHIKAQISGDISKADLHRNAKLYASFQNITSQEITFGTPQGLEKPEIVQEGSDNQPLIVAWGVPQGFDIRNYLLGNSYVYMNLQLPVTLHKKGLISARLELKTADAAASELISLGMLLQGGESIFLFPGAPPQSAISTKLEQPHPAKAGQRITIPVTIKGNVPSEYLSDLAAVQLRILDQHNILSPDEVFIEDVSGFGHPNIVFNGTDYLEIQFDRFTKLEDLQQALLNGITFNLNITLQQAGRFGMFAALKRVDEKGYSKGDITNGNVITITVE